MGNIYEVEIVIKEAFSKNYKYKIESKTFDELKTEILKRFGNLTGSNKSNREKKSIKAKVKESTNISELENSFNKSERWKIIIKK